MAADLDRGWQMILVQSGTGFRWPSMCKLSSLLSRCMVVNRTPLKFFGVFVWQLSALDLAERRKKEIGGNLIADLLRKYDTSKTTSPSDSPDADGWYAPVDDEWQKVREMLARIECLTAHPVLSLKSNGFLSGAAPCQRSVCEVQ